MPDNFNNYDETSKIFEIIRFKIRKKHRAIRRKSIPVNPKQRRRFVRHLKKDEATLESLKRKLPQLSWLKFSKTLRLPEFATKSVWLPSEIHKARQSQPKSTRLVGPKPSKCIPRTELNRKFNRCRECSQLIDYYSKPSDPFRTIWLHESPVLG